MIYGAARAEGPVGADGSEGIKRIYPRSYSLLRVTVGKDSRA